MKKCFVFSVFLISVLLLSCGTHKSPTAIIPPAITPTSPAVPCTAEAITFTTINIGNIACTGIGENTIVVINSQADYDTLCVAPVSSGTPAPTRVPIDFKTKTLIGIGIPYYCCSGQITSLVNITTDCNTITMNWQTAPDATFCNGIMCMAVCHNTIYYYFLIDKTYLPVTQKWTHLYCPTATPTACAPGKLNFNLYTIGYLGPLNGVVVINSQADFQAYYNPWAATGSPTPTPVPIDFTKNTLVGLNVVTDCGTSNYLESVTTDCSTVTMNWKTDPGITCNGIICNSVTSIGEYYLIDKTNLPVTAAWSYLPCPTPTP